MHPALSLFARVASFFSTRFQVNRLSQAVCVAVFLFCAITTGREAVAVELPVVALHLKVLLHHLQHHDRIHEG
ncbi:MAG: hypothetical protein CSA52_01415 [Gammaproteobacteria bacterium]|nr:MAG: hypothetical protein CSA52_01415 [Gammaproteobacteria bacterium]